MTVTSGRVPVDALFELECGCVLSGSSTSSPGRALFGPHHWWTTQGLTPPSSVPSDWMLFCTENPGHGWRTVTAATTVTPTGGEDL